MSTEKSKQKAPKVLITISAIFGILAFLASIGGFSKVLSEANYSSTEGTVISLDLKEDGAKPRTKNRCSPIVEFQVDGIDYTSGPDQYYVYGRGDECKYSIGDAITVRYDPADPSQATVSDSTFDKTMGIIGGALAIVLGIIVPIRLARKKNPASADA
jgi:hypothetical protein